ncbi:hypothetical protein C8R46DRAFT_1216216 [Mycena filopes]|nr:hypothetical protein C8R46DRAFT_1216216 [Mycena filopes]
MPLLPPLLPQLSANTQKSSARSRGITNPLIRNYVVSWKLRNEINVPSDSDNEDDDGAVGAAWEGPDFTCRRTNTPSHLDRAVVRAAPPFQHTQEMQCPSSRYLQDRPGDDCILDGLFNCEGPFNAVFELSKDLDLAELAEERLAWYPNEVFGSSASAATGSAPGPRKNAAAPKAKRATRPTPAARMSIRSANLPHFTHVFSCRYTIIMLQLLLQDPT